MDENEQKQQLSIAYLHAVASAAGFACQAPAVDDDSIDRTIVARGWLHKQAVLRSPKIDVQLKSTTREPLRTGEDSFVFRVNKKNYDDLRHPAMRTRYGRARLEKSCESAPKVTASIATQIGGISGAP